MAVLTIPCKTKHKSICLYQQVTHALEVMRVTKKHYSKCSVFAFDFEIRIKTILPLINRLIIKALLFADHVSITCCFSSLTSLTGSCVSVSVGVSRRWSNDVVFMQPAVKVNGA